MKAEIFPPLGAEYCKTGSLCSLEVSITRLSDLLEVDKDEALTESDGYCTTKLMYEGRDVQLSSIIFQNDDAILITFVSILECIDICQFFL